MVDIIGFFLFARSSLAVLKQWSFTPYGREGGGESQGQYCFQNYFQDIVCLFHCVEICLRGAIVMVAETAGSLAGI